MADPEGQKYLDFKMKQFIKKSERRALKMGLGLAFAVAIGMGPITYLSLGLIGLSAVVVIGALIIFTIWLQGVVSVDMTMDFIHTMAQERQEAIR